MIRSNILAAVGAALLALLGQLSVAHAHGRLKSSSPTDGAILVTVTDETCEPAELTVPAGKATFRIHNASERPLEWEILDGVMVVAETIQSGTLFDCAALDAVSGFDESLVIDGVDTDLSLRLADAGWHICVAPISFTPRACACR